MKVLTATCAAWLLQKIGHAMFIAGYKLECRACDIEDWAGIVGATEPDDEFRYGGTD